jgi:single-stranded DNA-binding protein
MQVIGNIGTPVEKIISKNGKEYFRFRLAENHNSKPKAETAGAPAAPQVEGASTPPKQEPTWYHVNAFIDEQSADLLAKGTFVSVTGRLEASPYLNKENQPAVRLTIMAGKVEPIKRKEREAEAA